MKLAINCYCCFDYYITMMKIQKKKEEEEEEEALNYNYDLDYYDGDDDDGDGVDNGVYLDEMMGLQANNDVIVAKLDQNVYIYRQRKRERLL